MNGNIVFTVLFYFAFAISALNACQCVAIDPSDNPSDKGTLEELQESTAELFVGRVVDVQILNVPTDPNQFVLTVKVALLIVDRLWLGKHQWRKTVYTEGDGPACGIDFKVGEHYLIQDTDLGELAASISKIDTDAVLTNRCSSTLFDPNKEAAVMEKFDKEWKPWIPNIQLDHPAR